MRYYNAVVATHPNKLDWCTIIVVRMHVVVLYTIQQKTPKNFSQLLFFNNIIIIINHKKNDDQINQVIII